MIGKSAPFFDFDHYSSLRLPRPIPLPPQAWILIALDQSFQRCAGKFRGRTHVTAPVNPPMDGIGRGSTLATSHRPTGFMQSPVGSQAFLRLYHG